MNTQVYYRLPNITLLTFTLFRQHKQPRPALFQANTHILQSKSPSSLSVLDNRWGTREKPIGCATLVRVHAFIVRVPGHLDGRTAAAPEG
jgi:hypothetical protein